MLKISLIFVFLLSLLGYFTYDFITHQNIQKETSPLLLSSASPSSPTSFPSMTPRPSLPPFPELSNAASMKQRVFKEPDFPFQFSYPDYFEHSNTDIAQVRSEALKRDPHYKWNMLAQTFIGVPFSVYDNTNGCSNMARISISKFSNSDNQSLYEFIKAQYKSYPGNGMTADFNTYEKNLTKIDFPRPNSYQFDGIIGENPVKTIFFEYGDAFYSFYLAGGCNTGEGYSSQANTFFLSIVKNLKFN